MWHQQRQDVHSTAAILTVRGSHEVGIVVTTTVLGIRNDSVVFSTSATKVILLEVARDFVKAIPIQ